MDLIEKLLIPSSLSHTDYDEEQLGSKVLPFSTNKELSANLAIVGINDFRGQGKDDNTFVADKVRHYLFQLYSWEKNISILDFGNIQKGHHIEDTEEAIALVQETSLDNNIPLVIIGGSQNLTIGQYKYFVKKKQVCNLSNIDAIIDFNTNTKSCLDKRFLYSIFLEEPNYMKSYFHIGLQSYLQKPNVINKLFNLNFETHRIGKIREDFSYIEPCLRQSSMLSIDIQSLSHASSPASILSPNGFNSEEFCLLGQYAGMSKSLQSIGIYGYAEHMDNNDITAQLIAQFVWFILEGQRLVQYEGKLEEKDKFIEYPVFVDNVKTIFYQSRVTGRWWMQIENCKPLPCAYQDYLYANKNELTDRWSSYFSLQ